LRASNSAGTTTKAGIITIVPAGAVNGQCGGAHTLSFTHAPETDLCLKGTATPVLGDGPWTWTLQWHRRWHLGRLLRLHP
jgi:hypothetical protein